MSRATWFRVVWVASLVLALVASHILLIKYGVEWGAGAAP
jgi:hypothetical protein